MKTRRSITNQEILGKTEGNEKSKECKTEGDEKSKECETVDKVCRSPIIRTLRSRVITSDNEDEVQSNKKTPKRRISRGSTNDDKSLRTVSDEVTPSLHFHGDKSTVSPKSSRRRFSAQKLFKITEINEENEAAAVKVEGEKSDSQETRNELVYTVIDKLKKEESEIFYSNDLVKEVTECFNEEKERQDKLIKEELENADSEVRVSKVKKESENSDDEEERKEKLINEDPENSDDEKAGSKKPVTSPRILHNVSRRKSSIGFIELPIEDAPDPISSSDSSAKKSAEDEEEEKDGYQSEDERSTSDSKTTDELYVDSSKEQMSRAMRMTEQAVIKEKPNEGMADDTSSNNSYFKKIAQTEASLKGNEQSKGSESDDERSTAVSLDSSEIKINTAMRVTVEAIRRDKEEEEQHNLMKKSLEKLKQEAIENTPEETSSDESSEKSIKTEAIAEDSKQSEDDESDSDEDMPEAISFDAGKDQTNRAMTMAAEAIRKEKERRKELQKKRMEVTKLQKQEKERKLKQRLKHLEASLPERLSEDLIRKLPDVPEIPTIRPSDPKKKKKKRVEETLEGKESVKEGPMLKKKKITKFDDYIPLCNIEGATKFGVVPLDVMRQIPKSASERAAEFKQQALFGSRIKREPSKSLLIYKQKISASNKSRQINQQQIFKKLVK